MRKSLLYLLAFSILYSGCASKKYTVQKFEEDKSFYNKFRGKRVEILLQNDKKIVGYFAEPGKDSLKIYIPRKEILDSTKIALKDVKTIKIKKKAEPGLEFVFLFLIIFSLIVVGSASVSISGIGS